jgi:hypothetical protein
MKNVAAEQLLGTAAHVYRMALGIDRMSMDWGTWEGTIFVSRESMFAVLNFLPFRN